MKNNKLKEKKEDDSFKVNVNREELDKCLAEGIIYPSVFTINDTSTLISETTSIHTIDETDTICSNGGGCGCGGKKRFIPKSTKVFGRDIEIKFIDGEVIDKDNRTKDDYLMGRVLYRENRIELRKSTESDNISDDESNVTYFHELVHLVMEKSHIENMLKDSADLETFVDLMATGIYDALKNSEY